MRHFSGPSRYLMLLAVVSLLPAAGARANGTILAEVQSDGEGVANAVVYAAPLDGQTLPRPQAPTAIMDQIDREFVPHVLPVFRGTSVSLPNSDETRHSVYSFSRAKTFERNLYAGSEAKPVVFDQIGVVTLGCNIHDWMLGYIYVLDTPIFARTGDSGHARLTELAAGRYRVRVWQPRLKAEQPPEPQTVSVANETIEVHYDVQLNPPRARPQRGFGNAQDNDDGIGFEAN